MKRYSDDNVRYHPSIYASKWCFLKKATRDAKYRMIRLWIRPVLYVLVARVDHIQKALSVRQIPYFLSRTPSVHTYIWSANHCPYQLSFSSESGPNTAFPA